MNDEWDATFVERYYRMNRQTEKVLHDGTLLENGMVVLLADPKDRWDIKRMRPSEMHPNDRLSVKIENRWCTVSDVEVIRGRNKYTDDLVSFTATYEDGWTCSRLMTAEHPWIVKLKSIPKKRARRG